MTNKSKIPTIEENPKGLHGKYFIQKIKGFKNRGRDFFGNLKLEYDLEFTDENSEYFVLRLDKNGKDKNHINACRKAVLKYADEIEPHIPQLAKDLRERYSRILY